jgi:Predicted sugar kinase
MNKNQKNHLLKKKIMKANKFVINPIEVKITNLKKKIFKMIAVNEISLFRQSKQTANLQIKVNQKNLIKELVSDGVLVSTPAGSTAYNLSVNGPILSLDSKKIALTPISPFRPRRWKGKLISDRSKINITNLQSKKRPISAVADNNEIRNIKKIEVKVNKKIKINLLFDGGSSLIKKIKEEQKKIN